MAKMMAEWIDDAGRIRLRLYERSQDRFEFEEMNGQGHPRNRQALQGVTDIEDALTIMSSGSGPESRSKDSGAESQPEAIRHRQSQRHRWQTKDSKKAA